MLLASILSSALAATPAPQPEVAVVLTRREGMDRDEADGLLLRVRETLAAAGLKEMLAASEQNRRLQDVSVTDTASCEAQRACAVDLGALLRVPVVVAVELGALRRVWAVHLEVLSVAEGKSTVTVDQTLGKKDPGATLSGLEELVAKASEAARAAPAPTLTSDAPVDNTGKLTSHGVQLSAVTTKALYGLKPRTVGLTTGAVGLAAGGAALAFLAIGRGQEAAPAPSPRPDGTVLYAMSRDRAQAQLDAANVSYTVALTCGVVAAALTAVSGWLLLGEEQTSLED